MAGPGESVRQLDHRNSDGVEVTLNYLPGQDPPIRVDVVDAKQNHTFSFKVAGGLALEAFRHPFAHAAHQGIETQPAVQVEAA